nr:hypothetical protein [Candidatus Njordarchaeum guaymaensis]
MSKKGAETLAREAVDDKRTVSQLLEGILSKKEATRYDSFKALLLLSGKHPEVLYPEWDFFAKLIDSDNNSMRYIALHIVANLATVDAQNKFDKIFGKYFSLLDDKNLPTAAHLAGNSGKIAKAKPQLQTKITNKLLSIDKTHHSPEHKDLIKSYAIESFSEFFGEAKDKREIMKFVKKQLQSRSPRTRKTAKEFLKRWEK